jgi:hypothetical protein
VGSGSSTNVNCADQDISGATTTGSIHEDEYLECDYCNEYKDWICLKNRYYNYGFSKHSYLACMECHDTLFGPFRLVDGGDSPKGINNLNKDNKVLWEFTYRILYEKKERIKVVNKDPDNLLVQWVPGGRTLTEILKANRVKSVRVWEY